MCMVQHYFPSVNFHHIVALEDSGKFPIRVQRSSVVDHWKTSLQNDWSEMWLPGTRFRNRGKKKKNGVNSEKYASEVSRVEDRGGVTIPPPQTIATFASLAIFFFPFSPHYRTWSQARNVINKRGAHLRSDCCKGWGVQLSPLRFYNTLW